MQIASRYCSIHNSSTAHDADEQVVMSAGPHNENILLIAFSYSLIISFQYASRCLSLRRVATVAILNENKTLNDVRTAVALCCLKCFAEVMQHFKRVFVATRDSAVLETA